MTARGAAIEIRDVTKRFDAVTALARVSLSVGSGEVVCLCGPSGCGKSTLLRVINFLVEPDEGFIYFDGKPVGRLPNQGGHRPRRDSERNINRLRAEIGIVFQQFNLWPHRTTLENVVDPLVVVQRMAPEAARARAIAALERVGMVDFADRYPARLSGGQQQRAAIARALAMQTRAFLFDEPTSSLDPEFIGEVLAAIKDVAKLGATVVLVTHHLGFANEIADRLVFMDKGRIVESGPPREMLSQPKSERMQQFLARVLTTTPAQAGRIN